MNESDRYEVENLISQFPDLPERFRSNLARLDGTSTLVSQPGSKPSTQGASAIAADKDTFFERIFWMDVSYPVTRCSPLGRLEPAVMRNLVETSRDTSEAVQDGPIGVQGLYKLTSINEDLPDIAGFCWVDWGPWSIKVRQLSLCDSHDFYWSFPVEGTSVGSTDVYLSWWGEWDDMPDSYTDLTFITSPGKEILAREVIGCCSPDRVLNNDGECVPISGEPDGPITPA